MGSYMGGPGGHGRPRVAESGSGDQDVLPPRGRGIYRTRIHSLGADQEGDAPFSFRAYSSFPRRRVDTGGDITVYYYPPNSTEERGVSLTRGFANTHLDFEMV